MQWFKTPFIARCLMALTFVVVLISGSYELVFVKLFVTDEIATCVVEFPISKQSLWIYIHQIVSIIHIIVPLLINLCSTAGIIAIVVKNKMSIRMVNKCQLYAHLLSRRQKKISLNVSGPFGKLHAIGDEPSPHACNRSTGIRSSSKSLTVMSINVSATVYSSNDEVAITWTPVLASCIDDFVGIYFVNIDPWNACDYFDYKFVKKDQRSTSWHMANLRHQLDSRYYSRDHNCSGNYSLITKSPVIEPLNYNEPTHAHLAYGNRIDQICVSYLTNSSEFIPQCQYRLSPLSLNFQQNGTITTYTASYMCEEKATIWVNKNESVYLIACGDKGLSPVQLGAKSTIERVTSRIKSANVTCLLHIGDVSYARGIGALWDASMTQIEPKAARVPYMVGIGNHEYDHATGGEPPWLSGYAIRYIFTGCCVQTTVSPAME
ncbi:unnamed protein product [Rotaria magnacalcarata]|uniref:Acid phosphatase n=1 Tax=Rotaria magnacalcarata TaxID=392030 RepID=A0A814M0E7_9BILA|nr:unnamed protein product [Rotaria magnacalcarata]CAF2141184.1 unnamed protein product [Rotaria magnacalcarata]